MVELKRMFFLLCIKVIVDSLTYFAKQFSSSCWFYLFLRLMKKKSINAGAKRLNEFSQVRTRVCDTYCSHHLNAFGSIKSKRKVNMYDTRSKICLIQSSIISIHNWINYQMNWQRMNSMFVYIAIPFSFDINSHGYVRHEIDRSIMLIGGVIVLNQWEIE